MLEPFIKINDNGGTPSKINDNGGTPSKINDNGGTPSQINDNGGTPSQIKDNGRLSLTNNPSECTLTVDLLWHKLSKT